MEIRRIELENVRCHKNLSVDMAQGTNLILGQNGAGKTSILMALAWAVFDYLPVT